MKIPLVQLLTLVFAATLFPSQSSYSQARLVKLGIYQAEPLTTTNPLNEREVVITAHRNLLYISKDGGNSWMARDLILDPNPKDGGDPVPVYSNEGKLLVACLSG